MLYLLVTAMYPCFLITLNEELISVPITVRVGQVRTVRDSNIQSPANYILQATGNRTKMWLMTPLFVLLGTSRLLSHSP